MHDFGEVAVILPSYNRRDVLAQAVKSVLDQTYTNLRCIVVDNGSTDGTAELLASFQDPRLGTVSHDKPLGPGGARNLGMAAATSAPWVAFLDSDDIWAPAKLGRQLEALNANPSARWSAISWTTVDANLTVLNATRLRPGPLLDPQGVLVEPEELLRQLCNDNHLPVLTSAVLVSRDLVDKVGSFDPHMPIGEDWDYYVRLARESPLLFLDLPLVACRVWEGQTTVDWPAVMRGISAVRRRHLQPNEAPFDRHHLAGWEQEAARRHLVAHRRLEAGWAYMRAAWLGRAPGQLAYALASVGWPQLALRRLRRIEIARRLPEGWHARTEPWLAPYRTGP